MRASRPADQAEPTGNTTLPVFLGGLRDYAAIAAELERRHGWKMDRRRVWYLCRRAERKIAAALTSQDRKISP